MKLIFIFLTLVLSVNSNAESVQNLCKILEVKNEALLYQARGASSSDFCRQMNGSNCNNASTFSKAICYIFDGKRCQDTRSIYDGVCRANFGDACSLTRNPGNGICRSLHGNLCAHTNNIGEGICRGLRGINCRFVDSSAEINYWVGQLTKLCPGINSERTESYRNYTSLGK